MRSIFDNGNKLIALMLMFLAGAVIYAATVWLWPSEPPPIFAPLSVSNVTINSKVEGFGSPAVQVGGHYNGTIEICNSHSEQQTITFIIQVERLSGPVRFVDLSPVDFPKQPGCETFTGDSEPLPIEITPGLWRESSSAIVQQGDQKQTVSFVSEPFEVVP